MDVLSLLSKANDTSRASVRDVLPVGSLVLLLAALVAGGAPASPPDVRRALDLAATLTDLAAELRQLPPARSLRPTMLGNLISRAEEDAGARYGFDTRVAIPRLDPLLRESVRAALNTARDELNFSVRLTITSMLATISSAVVLHRHGWWLLVPAVALTSAWLCYKNSIAAAAKYGEELHVAFDLDRFKLYEESHLGTPQNRDEELKLAQQLTEFWTYGRGDGDGVG